MDSGHRQDLGGGLVARWSRAGDAQRIAETASHVFRRTAEDEPNLHVGAWIRDMLSGRHPHAGPNDFAIVEDSASAPVYALLKREDEQAVTERAYENPRFVEDVVREVTRKLSANGNFPWFTVEAENFESIHNHSAYALVEWGSR